MLLLLSACIELPLVQDPVDLVLPTQEATNIRVETNGSTWFLEADGPAVLTRYLDEAEVLTLGAESDRSALEIVVSTPGGFDEGDVFPLGVWGEQSTESNGIVIAGLDGLTPIGLTTGHPDGLDPTGTITITALDDDTVSLSFDGELYRENDDDDPPVLQRVQGWVDGVALEREQVDVPAP